ncbi:hypothetical protein HMPREF1051_1867 [Neisseria sicca VK64]|uniref:Uncharacterized protein n=1 Tax=Neisseria sicca VK64 TaxID=1095748 RepID=I2NUV3_NEISI|nr:hypothetical protein HMPREF1051_1867 [Neisseria sicca VK64]
MGFAHESNSKFQTTSFTQHYRGQSPRYNVYRLLTVLNDYFAENGIRTA